MASNPIYCVFSTRPSLAPFLLRMALASMFFYHGVQETFGWFGGRGWNATTAHWASVGTPAVITTLVAAAGLAASVSLFLGLFTRLGGILVVLVAGLGLALHGVANFNELELPLLTMAAGFSLAFLGGGLLSMDRAISANLLPEVG